MRRRLFCVVMVACSVVFVSSAFADEPGVQPLRWNVFLSDWQVLGPFPKEETDATGLEAEYFSDEAALTGGQVQFYENQIYTWRPWDGGVIDFRKAMKAYGQLGNEVVGYAWTRVSSPVDQKALLAIGYDDNAIAWVNGKPVVRGEDKGASSLDQEVVEVDLKAGVNTVLLRVGQGTRAWDAVVRFLPAGVSEPLLAFRCQPVGDLYRLPIVTVTLLDAKQRIVAQHECSGLRKRSPGISGYFELFATMPETQPATVRFTVDAPGFQKVEKTVPWQTAVAGTVSVPLLADRPVELLVVDGETRRPVAGAEVWTNAVRLDGVSDAEGRITLPNFNAMINQCAVVAKGYAAHTVTLTWPRGEVQRAELKPGGRTLSGTVVSESGMPLSGARVTSGLSGVYAPVVVADENGRFELLGIPEDRSAIYPVIECTGYVAKDRFSVDLANATTEVRWELSPEATIVGRVTHQTTGEPLAGIEVTTGDDRFASNNRNPTTKTNAGGEYRLVGVPPGINLVHAFSDEHAPAMQSVTSRVGTAVQANFQLSDGSPVTGVIRDEDGEPVADVWLVTDTWNGVRMFKREAHTDQHGRFTLAHMPDSATEVDILKSGYVSNRNFVMRGGDVVELTLNPAVTHTIEIRDATTEQIVPGLQIAKGYLWEGNSDWSWRSDEWETERFYNKLTGVMSIEIDEPYNAEIAYRFRATGFREEVVKLPPLKEGNQKFQVRLKSAGSFAGQVVDAATGLPLPEVIVAMVSAADRMGAQYYVNFKPLREYLEQDGFTGARDVTDRSGKFRLPLPVGDIPVGIALVGENGSFHYLTSLNELLRSDDLGDREITLPLPQPGTIEGRFTVAGEPMADSPVHIQWLGQGRGVEGPTNEFGVGGQIVTDADGRYQFPPLGPGRYRICRVFEVKLGGKFSTSTYLGGEEVVLLPGQRLVHDITRPAGITLSGVTSDSAGRPLGHCVITVAPADDLHRAIDGTVCDADGRFTFPHLPANSYRLRGEHRVLTSQGYYDEDMRGVGTVDLRESVQDFELRLAPIRDGSKNPSPAEQIGTLAADFEVTVIGEPEPFVLSRHFGQVVVVSFWGADMDDIEQFNEFHRKFGDHPEVELVYVFGQDKTVLGAFLSTAETAPTFPIVTTEEGAMPAPWNVLGMAGSPGGFVIGRDGRIVNVRVPISKLGAEVDAALARPLDSTLSTSETGRLEITVSVDGAEKGVPRAVLTLTATDATGEVVRKDSVGPTGITQNVVWHYPHLASGGRLTVSFSGPGVEDQQRVLANPSLTETMRFDVESPRAITGRVLSVEDESPVAGVRLLAKSFPGAGWSATSDVDGRFRIPCFPGQYYVVGLGNERFAITTANVQIIEVTEDIDPQPIVVKAAPAVTVRGRVVEKTGTPVAGAVVLMQGNSKTTTDADGNFTLAGVPSIGTVTLYAMIWNSYGAIRRHGARETDPPSTIVIGEGLNDEPAGPTGLLNGGPFPSLAVHTLEGVSVEWSPTAPTDRLLVVGPFWHPEFKPFLEKAQKWALEHEVAIELFSLDWNLKQAEREFAKLAFAAPVYFAGPFGVEGDLNWSAERPTAFLIDADGRFRGRPLE